VSALVREGPEDSASFLRVRTPVSSPARALLTLGLGAVFAVVFGAMGYQFRADIVGVFLGQILFATVLLPVVLIWQYFSARPENDGSA